jgi:hypothetical protein
MCSEASERPKRTSRGISGRIIEPVQFQVLASTVRGEEPPGAGRLGQSNLPAGDFHARAGLVRKDQFEVAPSRADDLGGGAVIGAAILFKTGSNPTFWLPGWRFISKQRCAVFALAKAPDHVICLRSVFTEVCSLENDVER